MKEALISIAFFHSINYVVKFVTRLPVLKDKVNKFGRGGIVLMVCMGFFVWQLNDYVQHKQPNYFEILEIQNTTPTPLLVKKRYQSIMNRIAQESKSISTDSAFIEELEEEAQQKKDKKRKEKKKEKKSRKKKQRKDMTPEELKIDDEKQKLREIYDCLMFSQCYQQYSKYGSYIPLEMMGQSFDLRIAQLFVYYFVFSLISGALSSEPQMKGLSFSRALAIVFLMNELEQIFYYQLQIDSMTGKDVQAAAQNDGGAFKKNHRIEFINSLFTDTYCVFERIEVQRLFYFFIFNCACTLSETFFVDKVMIEMRNMKVAMEKQKKILDIGKEIYKKYHNDQLEYKRKPLSTKSPPMVKVRNEVVKANAPEFSALRHGTSKMYQRVKATIWQGVNLVIGLVILFFVFKNQVLPIVRKRFGLYKNILLEKN